MSVTKIIVILGCSRSEITRKRIKRALLEFNSSPCVTRENTILTMLLFSGVEAEIMKKMCVEEFGIDTRFMILERYSRSTFENILNTKSILVEAFRECLKPKIVICTSSFHITRTILITELHKLDNFFDVSYIHTNEIVSKDEFNRENNNTLALVYNNAYKYLSDIIFD